MAPEPRAVWTLYRLSKIRGKMNITISKTAALRAIAIFMALVLLVWAASLALSMGFPARLFAAPTPLP